jgi:hypothetical protein
MDDENVGRGVIAFAMYVLVATGAVLADGPDAFRLRTVGTEYGVDCPIEWRSLVPERPVKPRGTDKEHADPWWVRAAEAAHA